MAYKDLKCPKYNTQKYFCINTLINALLTSGLCSPTNRLKRSTSEFRLLSLALKTLNPSVLEPQAHD